MLEFGPLWRRHSLISPLSQTGDIFLFVKWMRVNTHSRNKSRELFHWIIFTCTMQRKSRKLLSRTLTDLLYLWLQESTLKHPFMTDDYSPDDVAARVGGPVYKPNTNSNLLAMLSDDRTTNGLVMPEARCKWSALWKAASGARCHWQSVEADDRKSDSASQE